MAEVSCITLPSDECHRTLLMMSTLGQVMAWCHQARSHNLGQCWSRSILPYVITRQQWVNLLDSSWNPMQYLCIWIIALASHLCTCVLHRQLCYLHTLKLPKFFNFQGDFHQKWHFAHPEFSFAHPELPFLAKSMIWIVYDMFPE